MPTVKKVLHGPLAFPTNQGKMWFGWQVRNVGNYTVFPGRVVALYATTGASSGIYGWLTPLPTGSGDAAKGERRRILGVAQQTIAIAENGVYQSGYVVNGGYVTNLMVTGTCAMGDYLQPYLGTGARPGVCEQYSTDGGSRTIAFAYASHSGSASGILAFVFPWRP